MSVHRKLVQAACSYMDIHVGSRHNDIKDISKLINTLIFDPNICTHWGWRMVSLKYLDKKH